MAITVTCDNTEILSTEELIDFVEREIDLEDRDSLITCAPKLHALANDRDLIVRHLNELVRKAFSWNSFPSAQVIFLGRSKDFFLRANIWPSTAEVASGRIYQDQFSYYVGHDHNYHFLTAGYSGSGYITELYEYDNDRVQGFVGESVDLRFIERRHFCGNQVMLYEASKDVHTQYPPDELSVTLNLLVSSERVRLRDQYFFDMERKTLLAYPDSLEGSRRVSMLEIAGYAGNDDTVDLLEHIASGHPCRRTRVTSREAMARLRPDQQERIWLGAVDDREPLVSETARRNLERLAASGG